MEYDARKSAIEAIVEDIVKTLPKEIIDAYFSPPGRKPDPSLLSLSATVRDIGIDKGLALVKDVVDSTIFSLLYLIDANFKEKSIKASFASLSGRDDDSELKLVEEYRYRVDPGGIVV